ncbi:MAG: hypothetical protein ABJF50_10655 [Paracoccaceae bacterium]
MKNATIYFSIDCGESGDCIRLGCIIMGVISGVLWVSFPAFWKSAAERKSKINSRLFLENFVLMMYVKGCYRRQ